MHAWIDRSLIHFHTITALDCEWHTHTHTHTHTHIFKHNHVYSVVRYRFVLKRCNLRRCMLRTVAQLAAGGSSQTSSFSWNSQYELTLVLTFEKFIFHVTYTFHITFWIYISGRCLSLGVRICFAAPFTRPPRWSKQPLYNCYAMAFRQVRV